MWMMNVALEWCKTRVLLQDVFAFVLWCVENIVFCVIECMPKNVDVKKNILDFT